MQTLLLQLSALPRRAKQLVLLAADLVVLPGLFWLAHAMRLDNFSPDVLPQVPSWPLWIGLLGVGALALSGVYRAVVRAFDEKLLHDLIMAVSAVVAILFALALARMVFLPRTVPFMFGFFMFLWVWLSRSGIRWMVRKMVQHQSGVRRVAIYGAGAAGRQLLAALRASNEYHAVAFFDDALGMSGTTVLGLRVYAGKDFGRLHQQLLLDEVLIALPSASRSRRSEVINRLEPYKVHVRSLPGFTQLVGGEVSISDIRDVDIVDLLGRDAVPPSAELLQKDIAGKCVLVTGAGGSIGAELCRQVLKHNPSRLLLWELSEFALYAVDQELKVVAGNVQVIPVLGSVLHEERMASVMSHYGVSTVYHAAAYKHVPLVEWNPFEGIMNNAFGTLRAAKAAVRAGVSTFVLISTDKAVRPTNVMGASKRLAELALQALAAEPDMKTRFCMVRFGNVLGSSGSVVPLFRAQIAKGGPVTVTHPEVTRYFMTIPEASQLVIQAGAMGAGGDVFVLDMGESVRIVDLARKMIRLSGMTVREPGEPDGDIEIAYSGLRPGEKLYEELLIGSNVSGTSHPRIMRAMENHLPLPEYEDLMLSLREMARAYDVVSLKATLARVVEGYSPDMTVMGLITPIDVTPDPDAPNVVPFARREGNPAQ
ncbi:MAG TPA: polysaccharide biosynthesis protein [Moraxellaceae bacterium]|nr:polysaccharide biosynthesis protein [Moraxellaceae bacterium]